jgi:hypothetical protein
VNEPEVGYLINQRESYASLHIDLNTLAGIPVHLDGSMTAGVYLNGKRLYTTKEFDALRDRNAELIKTVERQVDASVAREKTIVRLDNENAALKKQLEERQDRLIRLSDIGMERGAQNAQLLECVRHYADLDNYPMSVLAAKSRLWVRAESCLRSLGLLDERSGEGC